jgi:serine protease DegQ
MKRAPLYSSPRRSDARAASPSAPSAATAPTSATTGASTAQGPTAASAAPAPQRRLRRALPLLALLSVLAVLAWQFGAGLLPRPLTQRDIDRAVLHTLSKTTLPSPAAKAYAAVRGSVVKVIGYSRPQPKGDAKDSKDPKSAKAPRARPQVGPEPEEPEERGVGTGVVIVDNGTILTNLHVVHGSQRIKVIFADGLEADADIVGLQPQHDLAVLKARKIPDDLQAATMRSTADLSPGDHVTAVGFPFGIGPSVSHGVVSGLKREFRSPEGQRILTNLIQFDAAANPGNSGGPLVTDDGEVVGIVTAIYNPTQERFFVGIGFAVPIENAAQAVGLPPF